jgi:hypothetical protein
LATAAHCTSELTARLPNTKLSHIQYCSVAYTEKLFFSIKPGKLNVRKSSPPDRTFSEKQKLKIELGKVKIQNEPAAL